MKGIWFRHVALLDLEPVLSNRFNQVSIRMPWVRPSGTLDLGSEFDGQIAARTSLPKPTTLVAIMVFFLFVLGWVRREGKVYTFDLQIHRYVDGYIYIYICICICIYVDMELL